jgi:hypothetical protein
MRILLFFTCYQRYVEQLYSSNPNLDRLDYQKQLDTILADYFGWPPALVTCLTERGCDIKILFVNIQPLQPGLFHSNRRTDMVCE